MECMATYAALVAWLHDCQAALLSPAPSARRASTFDDWRLVFQRCSRHSKDMSHKTSCKNADEGNIVPSKMRFCSLQRLQLICKSFWSLHVQSTLCLVIRCHFGSSWSQFSKCLGLSSAIRNACCMHAALVYNFKCHQFKVYFGFLVAFDSDPQHDKQYACTTIGVKGKRLF